MALWLGTLADLAQDLSLAPPHPAWQLAIIYNFNHEESNTQSRPSGVHVCAHAYTHTLQSIRSQSTNTNLIPTNTALIKNRITSGTRAWRKRNPRVVGKNAADRYNGILFRHKMGRNTDLCYNIMRPESIMLS